jgi:hypothetical protein
MAKARRAKETHAQSDVETAFQLWGKGNVAGARRIARRILESEGSASERAQAEELLKATSPDRRTRLVAFGSLLLLGLVLVVLKLLGA